MSSEGISASRPMVSEKVENYTAKQGRAFDLGSINRGCCAHFGPFLVRRITARYTSVGRRMVERIAQKGLRHPREQRENKNAGL